MLSQGYSVAEAVSAVGHELQCSTVANCHAKGKAEEPSLVAAWYLFDRSGTEITTCSATTGSSTGRSFYSCGAALDTERALGGCRCGHPTLAIQRWMQLPVISQSHSRTTPAHAPLPSTVSRWLANAATRLSQLEHGLWDLPPLETGGAVAEDSRRAARASAEVGRQEADSHSRDHRQSVGAYGRRGPGAGLRCAEKWPKPDIAGERRT
jgi:hypothetical protein